MVKSSRKKPYWDLAQIHACANAKAFEIVNTRARNSIQQLGWEIETIAAFLQALQAKHYRKSFPEVSAFDGRQKLQADAYKMHFDEENLVEGRSIHICVWAELSMHKRNSGSFVAVVSIHLDGQP